MRNKFEFILVKPQLGENIGACARSMKNFGFDKLHIVEPKINFPNHKAKVTSVGAYDIINKAKVFNGKIENFQGFTRFVAKSLKIWPIFINMPCMCRCISKWFCKFAIF